MNFGVPRSRCTAHSWWPSTTNTTKNYLLKTTGSKNVERKNIHQNPGIPVCKCSRNFSMIDQKCHLPSKHKMKNVQCLCWPNHLHQMATAQRATTAMLAQIQKSSHFICSPRGMDAHESLILVWSSRFLIKNQWITLRMYHFVFGHG